MEIRKSASLLYRERVDLSEYKESLIKIDGGGYRNPSSVETLQEKVVDEFGNIRSDEHGYMNGADVFNLLFNIIGICFFTAISIGSTSSEFTLIVSIGFSTIFILRGGILLIFINEYLQYFRN